MIWYTGAEPTFIIPSIPGFAPDRQVAHLPLMIYIPGIDGTGMAASRQFPALMGSFDFRSFSVPLNDRTPFLGLVDIVKCVIALHCRSLLGLLHLLCSHSMLAQHQTLKGT